MARSHRYGRIKKILNETSILDPINLLYDEISKPMRTYDGTLHIAPEGVLFDKRTGNVTKMLFEKKRISEKEEITIVKKLDEIFHLKKSQYSFNMILTEFYSFEQLVYLELMQLIENKYYISKCTDPNCNKYFISNRRIDQYCSEHTQNHSSACKKSYSNMSMIQKFKRKCYSNMQNRIQSWTESKSSGFYKELNENLKEWNKNAQKTLRDTHETENLSLDEILTKFEEIPDIFGFKKEDIKELMERELKRKKISSCV